MKSILQQETSYSERLRLNSAISRNIYWKYPVDDTGHENFSPVGRGRQASELCGKYVSTMTCKHTELHEGVVVKGVDYTGKIAFRHVHLWCNKSSCPICFISGWSARLARVMESRLAEGTRRGFGEVEHMMVSVPVVNRSLPEEVMRDMARKALLVRGVLGGCLIFHGFRPDRKRKVLVWSAHYHVLGYLRGGFKCRGCPKYECRSEMMCAGCDGFEARTREEFKTDGCIVRVFGERKTVVGTAWYQLNHATIRVGVKRFQVVTWFGVVSYNKLKAPEVKAEVLCQACHSEMSKSVHMGKERIVKDVGDPNYVGAGACAEFDSSGEPNYVDYGGRCL